MECNLTLHLRRLYLRFETLECPLLKGGLNVTSSYTRVTSRYRKCNFKLQKM